MIDNQTFKNALSQFASGVTVVTWAGDNPIEGITVSAFSSLSLNPPLVLFCIDQNAYAYKLMVEKEYFAVNILAATQTNLAYQFAGPNRNELESYIETDNKHGIPSLKDSHATLIVKVRERVAQGDHDIFIAEVVKTKLNADVAPLLYHQGQLFDPAEKAIASDESGER